MSSKPCNTCGAVKPLTAFSTKSAAADGREGICRGCLNTRKREHYTPLPNMGPKILALLAQAVRNKDHGVKAVMPAAPKVESVAEFLARGGAVHRLRNGDVSPASRFQRLKVRA